jgi:uncharacterized protein involved in outer membrane biogenesis
VKFLKICLLLIVLIPTLLIATLLIVPEKVDFSIYKPQIESFLKEKTGLNVSLGENVSIKLLPQPYIQAENVEIKAFVGNKKLFRADKFELRVSLKELLSMNLSIKKMLIESPTVYLHRNINNQANWQPKRVKRRGGNAVDLSFIKGLGDIVISNASFVFEDDLNGSQFRFLEGQFSVDGSRLEDTNIHVSGLLNSEKIESTVSLNLTSVTETKLNGDILLANNKLEFKGLIDEIFSEPAFTGELKLAGPSVFESMYKVLSVAPSQRYLDIPLSLESSATLSQDLIEFKNLKTVFLVSPTEISFISNISYTPVERSNKLGRIEAFISVADFVDLQKLPFCQKSPESKKPFAWSQEIKDFTFVKQLDADITFEALRGFACSGKSFDHANLRLTAEDGRVDMRQLVLGKGEGNVNATGHMQTSGAHAKGAVKMTSQNFDVSKFMGDNMKKRMMMPLAMNMDLRFEGKSTAEWIESLAGTVEISSTDMTTVGINPETLQSVMMSVFGLSGGKDTMAHGVFSMSGDIDDGVLRTENAFLTFPKVSVRAKGKVDLRRMVMNLKAVPDSENILGYDIPVLIKGSVFSPMILPDLTDRQGQGVAIGAVLAGPAGAALGSMIGSMMATTDADEASTTQKNHNEIMDEKQKLRDEVLRFLKSE